MTLWTVASASTSAAGAALVAGAEARFRLPRGGASEEASQILSHQIYLSVVGLSFCPYNRALSSIIPFLGDPYPDTPRTVNL